MKTLKELREKAVSQAQQKMMGMALAYKRGEMDDASPEVKKMANSMSMKDLEDFAKTKHKGLPDKVDENRYSPLQQIRKKKEAEDRKKKDGTSDSQYQRMKKKQYGGMMGGLKKEEVELDEAKEYFLTGLDYKGTKHTYKRRGPKVTDPIVVYIDGKEWKTFKSMSMAKKETLNYIKGMKEEVELDEAFTPKEIKMAIGVASDKRYAKGNMTGAVNAIEKIKKGLSDHPQVKAVLRRQNESLGEATDFRAGDTVFQVGSKLKGTVQHKGNRDLIAVKFGSINQMIPASKLRLAEEVELDEAAPKLKGNNGPYTRQQIEKAAKEAKVDIGAKARMMMALRNL